MSYIIDAMTTITTGICTANASCLITTTYKEGAGDGGYTASTTTTRDSKGNAVAPKLWSRLSRLQVAIGKALPYFKDEDSQMFLKWVWSNVRSLSSLGYLEGASDTHAFPRIAITYMEAVIAQRKAELGPSPSFIQWEHMDLLDMEDLWCEVRDTEIMYQEWASEASIHEEVQKRRIGDPSTARERVDTVLSILNRLSSYLWWGMRAENKLRGCRELVWQGYVTPFPFTVSTDGTTTVNLDLN